MHSDLRAQAAFRLTGLKADAGLPRRLRPALAARVRNLAALRYDFPVVLIAPPGDEAALPLTAIVDRLLEGICAGDADGARLRTHVLRLEREIRAAVARGAYGSLEMLWEGAASRLAASGSKALLESLQKARRALAVEGDVVDCDVHFPGRFAAHLWKAVESRKTAALHAETAALVFGLRQLLAADDARSPRAISAARLRETFGEGDHESIDFEAMSRLLERSGARPPLPDARRQRILALIASLEGADFYCGDHSEAYAFERCAPALRAFRARYDCVRDFVRALAMARLEVEGAYDEALHAALFRQLDTSPLSAEDLQRLPAYLVRLRWSELDAAERADLEDLLCSGMPARILVQTDDLLEQTASREHLAAIGSHAHALSGSALGLEDVHVVQAPASALPRLRDSVLRAFAYPGTALVSVYSGACGEVSSLPPYLNAAAALESRVFPALVYDPLAAEAERLSLAPNPHPESEWAVHDLVYEDAELQRAQRRVAFTPADFIACDARFARHFMRVEGAAAEDASATTTVLMVDDEDRLHELLADDEVAIQVRRSGNRWRHLQRLASRPAAAPAPAAVEPVPVEAKADAAPAPAAPATAAPALAAAPSSDEPYIETPRCTTCNECTQLNPRMFAYDANKQAYIADITAGTYRQLVEAAEACQVSIIHPGKPRDANEPGLEELLARAEPFR